MNAGPSRGVTGPRSPGCSKATFPQLGGRKVALLQSPDQSTATSARRASTSDRVDCVGMPSASPRPSPASAPIAVGVVRVDCSSDGALRTVPRLTR